jgi:hypothetical protein
MGCDIHLYIEYCYNPDKTDAYWQSFGHIRPGRDYEMFTALAGVRGSYEPIVHPRGVPDKMGFESEWDYYLTVNDKYKDQEGYCSTTTADRWVEEGTGERILPLQDGTSIRKVVNPDWHTPSWLTAEEFEGAIKLSEDRCGDKSNPSYQAILAAMKALPNARVVIWFDN